MKNNKKILLLGLLVLVCITLLVYTSYGYLSTKITGNENAKTHKYINNKLSIKFSDNTDIIVSNKDESFIPGTNINKTFTITNISKDTITYNVILDEVVNTFNRTQDIIYTFKSNGNILTNEMFPKDKTILTESTLAPDESIDYEININYLNSTENQIVDNGATISAKLVFE